MKTEASFWVDEAEFYHDKNGLMVGGPASVYHQYMDPNNFTRATLRTVVHGQTEESAKGPREIEAETFMLID